MELPLESALLESSRSAGVRGVAAPDRARSAGLLRLITCGSVDDGKSTLIGRLLYDTGSVPEDQREQLLRDCAARPGWNGQLDYALLLDGLAAEREQGITIDVAYRYFATPQRRFIIADCPGHEEYTRNMATAASTADAAVVLVDARKGILPQTRRHTRILSLFGVRQLVLAVNKMDLVGWSEARFRTLAAEYRELAGALGIEDVHAIPLSALGGDNLCAASPHSPWYRGSALLPTLERLETDATRAELGLRLAVQSIQRPHQDFRGIVGSIASGRLWRGQRVKLLPSGGRATVRRLWVAGVPRDRATVGQPVMVQLTEDVDVGRGDWLVEETEVPPLCDRLRADLLWLDDQDLGPGWSGWLRVGTRRVVATVEAIEYRLDVHDGGSYPARTLGKNGIGRVALRLAEALPLRPFAQERALGAFILIDRVRHATSAAGTVIEAISPGSARPYPEAGGIAPTQRAAAKGQRARCLWFTGRSGAGKSTLAKAVELALHAAGYHTMLLDGDNVRQGLSSDLGFDAGARAEQTRRLGEVARLLVDAGLIVLVASIAPQRAARERVRARFEPGQFLEIHVDAKPETCRRRDPKGLYAAAARGELSHPIGVSDGYQPPPQPELYLCNEEATIDLQVQRILEHLARLDQV